MCANINSHSSLKTLTAQKSQKGSKKTSSQAENVKFDE